MNTNGNSNGNSNGRGGSMTQRKIETLLAHHEGIAEALRTTLDLLRGEAITKKRQKGETVLAAALALESHRKTRGPYKKHRSQAKVSIRQQRQRSAEFLARFDPTEPRPAPPTAPQSRTSLGPLVRRGYLRKKGDGYIRTSKEYAL